MEIHAAGLEAKKRLLVDHPLGGYYLNSNLLDRQDCWDNVDKLIQTHKEKLDIFQRMKDARAEDTPYLKALAEQVKNKEFELQGLWGFPKDPMFHDWFQVPHCTCPYHDNMERKGTKYGVVSGDCPIHKVAA